MASSAVTMTTEIMAVSVAQEMAENSVEVNSCQTSSDKNNRSKAENYGNSPVIDLEVLQHSTSFLSAAEIESMTVKFLQNKGYLYSNNRFSNFDNEQMKQHVKELHICTERFGSISPEGKGILLKESRFDHHIFKLNSDGPGAEELEGEELSAANHWVLPSADFHGLWESLIYDSSIKTQLLNFVMTSLLFSDKQVDCNKVSWNRVVLLHGPPGTGKTSLCKALAQKISIRLSRRYKYGQLIEINSHSLFSKWFSESGKLVMKMFQKIQDLIDDSESLVFVLIDEVESLAHARNASMGGTEPSDAIRVVNAVLTQIDQIKRYPNVIILTTSNMTEAIDLAFVDRADIKYFIGMPSPQAIYQILLASLEELIEKQIIEPHCTLLTWAQLPSRQNHATWAPNAQVAGHSIRLQEIARSCEGLSGRTLKKLPFLAHALFISSSTSRLETFLEALSKAAIRQFKDKEDLKQIMKE